MNSGQVFYKSIFIIFVILIARKMSIKSQLFLIPISIDQPEEHAYTSAEILHAVEKCKTYFVENARTARRALKKIKNDLDISSLNIIAFDKHQGWPMDKIRQAFLEGGSSGLMSEAGCPAVADPGEIIVNLAHQLKVKVQPLVGPNSILLALMASGLNGQNFKFSSYLPIDKKELIQKLRNLEQESLKFGTSQIFIETPYRNNELLNILLDQLKGNTLLTVASGIQTEKERIYTDKVSNWKKNKWDLHKIPTVFIFLAKS